MLNLSLALKRAECGWNPVLNIIAKRLLIQMPMLGLLPWPSSLCPVVLRPVRSSPSESREGSSMGLMVAEASIDWT